MRKKTIKLLFVCPNRVPISRIEKSLAGLSIIPVFEDGAHPAYIVDTGIEVENITSNGELLEGNK